MRPHLVSRWKMGMLARYAHTYNGNSRVTTHGICQLSSLTIQKILISYASKLDSSCQKIWTVFPDADDGKAVSVPYPLIWRIVHSAGSQLLEEGIMMRAKTRRLSGKISHCAN